MPDPRKIMIIRHAEKPPKHRRLPQGVDLAGQANIDQLIPQGWQRAGALVRLFAPLTPGTPVLPIERPDAVFAAGTSDESSSLRAQSTVGPVAALIQPGTGVHVLAAPGNEAAAAADILASGAAVALVCWEQRHITDLVQAIGGAPSPHWHHSRFDVTLVLTRTSGGWDLAQAPQLLLPGDMDAPVSVGRPDAADDEDDE